MKTTRWMVLAVTIAMAGAGTPALATHADDQRIVSSAKKSYVYRTYLKGDKIHIDARDGVVTLRGTVAEKSHKAMAEDTVEGLPGVRTVINELEISSRDYNEQSDRWIEMKVKRALLFNRNVSSANTEVSVRDGVVTLRGKATSPAQKELTTEYVRDIDGVRSVNNELTVVPEPPGRSFSDSVDDASITAQAKAALMMHRSTSGLRTKITTHDGVVTIGGEAKNPAEKDLVTKIISDIHGVRSVVNNMEARES
jgi:hyperosmotically inducible periplasmic protein